jgi:hypothetical protein
MLPFGNQPSFRVGFSSGHSLKDCHASQGLTTGTERVLPSSIVAGALSKISHQVWPSLCSRVLSVLVLRPLAMPKHIENSAEPFWETSSSISRNSIFTISPQRLSGKALVHDTTILQEACLLWLRRECVCPELLHTTICCPC